MSNVFILLFLVTMIFALLGMQIFGGQFNEAHGYGEEDEGFCSVTVILTTLYQRSHASLSPLVRGMRRCSKVSTLSDQARSSSFWSWSSSEHM